MQILVTLLAISICSYFGKITFHMISYDNQLAQDSHVITKIIKGRFIENERELNESVNRLSATLALKKGLKPLKLNVWQDTSSLNVNIKEQVKSVLAGNTQAQLSIISTFTTILASEIANTQQVSEMTKRYCDRATAGVIFLGLVMITLGMILRSEMKRSLVTPLAELDSVLTSFTTGDIMRRCSGSDIPEEIRTIYRHVNDILDQKCSTSGQFKL